jgi:CheY-like chemotaxis protein
VAYLFFEFQICSNAVVSKPDLALKRVSATAGWLLRLSRPAGGIKKVLIVDDDEIIRATTSAKLRKCGYHVVTAADASEAIAAVRDEKPDVVLLDISFPPDVANGGRVTWDGFQIMNWLGNLKRASHTQYIFITSSRSAQDRRRALAGGARDYFVKPINHRALLPAIERALG